jgi:hypothetical protein
MKREENKNNDISALRDICAYILELFFSSYSIHAYVCLRNIEMLFEICIIYIMKKKFIILIPLFSHITYVRLKIKY